MHVTEKILAIYVCETIFLANLDKIKHSQITDSLQYVILGLEYHYNL